MWVIPNEKEQLYENGFASHGLYGYRPRRRRARRVEPARRMNLRQSGLHLRQLLLASALPDVQEQEQHCRRGQRTKGSQPAPVQPRHPTGSHMCPALYSI